MFGHNEDMTLTAFIGHGGPNIQFTIGENFCALAPNQIRDLIITLQNRLECKEGYRATDSTECEEILPLEEMGQ